MVMWSLFNDKYREFKNSLNFISDELERAQTVTSKVEALKEAKQNLHNLVHKIELVLEDLQ